jgi:hypothetical protein
VTLILSKQYPCHPVVNIPLYQQYQHFHLRTALLNQRFSFVGSDMTCQLMGNLRRPYFWQVFLIDTMPHYRKIFLSFDPTRGEGPVSKKGVDLEACKRHILIYCTSANLPHHSTSASGAYVLTYAHDVRDALRSRCVKITATSNDNLDSYHTDFCTPLNDTMNTSLLPKSKLSYERSFDDMVDTRKHLLFRLHSHNSSWTFFHPKEKVLVASLHCQELSEDSSSEELSLRLTAPEKAPSSLTLEEDSEAVERHVTSWLNEREEPSNYISLTFDVLYVLWMWKRRIHFIHRSKGRQDDFRIIVLNSSKLRASRPAKLGT